MAKTKQYQHFCPVARSLEIIGEKWSLLVVRDLLRGPQRFTDLLRYLGGITPKWLTLRLRELEAAGIVERDREPGRREVWYRLTPKGRELAPVVEGLMLWGIDHAMQPPRPGEPIHPEQTMGAIMVLRNRRGVRLPRAATWLVRLGSDRSYTIRFNGEHWSVRHGERDADLTIEASDADWVAFLTAQSDGRAPYRDRLRLSGPPDRVQEFLESFAAVRPLEAIG